MEFGFRAGDRRPRPRRRSPDRRFTPPQAGPSFHGELPPPPSPFEWEAAAALRARIIRDEVERRLFEEEVQRELALARASRFHGGFGPVVPPPPHPGPFFVPDGPFAPPMPPLHMMPVVGMHPNCPPPALFGSWEGCGPRRLPGFGQPMPLDEARARPLPPPKLRHKLQLRHIAHSESSEVLSVETKASGVKRKADAISASSKPTKLQNASSATTEPTKLQTAPWDWSCALCQVSATSEAGLNQHLEGKKHKAKLVQCGVIKVTDTNRSGLQVTTGNNKPEKIHILVDGELHQVVQKSNCVWCERCRVSCTNAAAMADHLRGKKHSLLNKVWTSIQAVRMNKEAKKDSTATSTCERKVDENGPTGMPEEHKEEGTYMTSEFSGDDSFEIPMGMKEITDMAEVVDASSHNEISVEIKKEEVPVEIKKEDDGTASKVNSNCAVETKQEGTDVDVVMDVNKNLLLKVNQKTRNKAIKKYLKCIRNQNYIKNKNFQFKVHQKSRKEAKKWLGIREVNENSCIEITAEERHNDETTDAGTDLTEPERQEE